MSTCVACQNPLEIDIESDENEDVQMSVSSGKAAAVPPQTFPDDVHLTCECHFHWDCLLEAYQITECPNCNKNIASTSSSGVQQVLCDLNNEGGLQKDLDILPLLTEESYLKAYPEERKCRAFLEFCREGDVKAVVGILQDDSDSDDSEDENMEEAEESEGRRTIGVDELLRYQDPIGDMQSGLHAAVHAQSREVAWLLLLLASNLPLLEFPAEVFQEAETLGLMRGLTEDKTDIRSMKDVNGKTAEDLAKEVGGVWVTGWVGNQHLAV